jgi:hypothetical protein
VTRLAGLLLWLALALPWVRDALERVMLAHMLVQIPLLAIAGALVATSLPPRVKERVAEWNRGGITGTLLALIVSSWWMVPRALDWVLVSPSMELLKFVSLPLFVGAPIALSWRALGFIGRGFVVVNVLPMWAVVGWLYLAAPVRVCNYYLVDQQIAAGAGLLWASTVLGIGFCALAFRPARS